MLLKTSKGEIVTCSFICVLYFCLGVFMLFGAFGAFWCVWNLLVKKNKEFKTALVTSFTLLLIILSKVVAGNWNYWEEQTYKVFITHSYNYDREIL